MFIALEGSIELGLLYVLMALGVYISFRILDFPDLTVDGSFTTGAAVSAVMITHGYAPLLATLSGFLAGAVAGTITGLLHTKGKINNLLSGIVMMIALYSINLRIMGKPNTPLFGENTVFSVIPEDYFLVIVPVVIIILKLLVDAFLHTDIGFALRATGDNQRMIRSFGVNTDFTIILGIALSNGLVAMSGALVAQYQGFADISMGVGMIVIGLASVIIGEAIFGHKTVFRATLAVLLGAIVYRMVIALALQLNMNAEDLKLITALIVVAALILPKIQKSLGQKRKILERIREVNNKVENNGRDINA
ncbi:ABC transporter permease [Chengkuizengella marina]|uniref:ABC transporter permease n=1 Tax=Chengkuizengella marina TaxID=2507566 RepID=A0A6N9PZT1_9BACL|nr:ABC transporter permease [Chengkuizengella marina]NBI29009.1 ABC transporter permease [Chengkuizengella marina]